jgi:hypothetical protein
MHRTSSPFIPLAPLAGSLLLLFAPMVAVHAAHSTTSASAGALGMTIAVRNCRDSGPGSLRAAVAGALSGDIIDMTALACYRIKLSSGPIMIPQDDLTLVGNGRIRMDGDRRSSVFRHSGTGTLRIESMTLTFGNHRSDTQPLGGCLYSAGNVEISNALVHWCHVQAIGNVPASGGGLYAAGAVTVTSSQVVGNTAGYVERRTIGGGIYAGGRLIVHRSRICGNRAYRGGGAWSGQGGLEAHYTTFSNNAGGALEARDGNSVIANSTISDNTSHYFTVFFDNRAAGGSAVIVNSTISGNASGSRYGSHRSQPVVGMHGGTKSIVNSTIAFNRRLFYCGWRTGTVHATGPSMHIESAILANNSCDGNSTYDIAGNGREQFVIEGANNLITSSDDRVVLPPDTISADPRLAPLADNGGLTKTHALLDDSPAIDMGNNAADLAHDQRGPGFPRVNGTQADIGAYER